MRTRLFIDKSSGTRPFNDGVPYHGYEERFWEYITVSFYNPEGISDADREAIRASNEYTVHHRFWWDTHDTRGHIDYVSGDTMIVAFTDSYSYEQFMDDIFTHETFAPSQIAARPR